MTREGSVKSRRDMQEMLEKGIADGLFVKTINIDLAISVLFTTRLRPSPCARTSFCPRA